MLKTATALVIWILALVACGASATSVPPGNTPNIDATAAAASQAMTQAMPAPTVVPTPLPTAVPTIPAPTSTPTPTETLAPTPTPAPSGRIVFESHRDGRNNYEIYVMNPDGSGVTRLTNDSVNDTEPSWSPDGSRIAFVAERDGNGEIYVMNADGSGVTRLTNDPALDYARSWSPDGGPWGRTR